MRPGCSCGRKMSWKASDERGERGEGTDGDISVRCPACGSVFDAVRCYVAGDADTDRR